MRPVTKRLFDLVVAFCALSVLLPLLVLLSLVILLVDGLPVFFVQERVGLRGRRFKLIKFRTMAAASGPLVTAADDRRQTALGRFLRRRKFDELPQLYHVIMGTMSLVGPRPEVPEFVDVHDPQQELVQSVRPGLVDPAVLEYLNEEQQLNGVKNPEAYYMQEIKPKKLALSAAYIKEATFMSDLGLLARAGSLVLWRSSR